MKRLTTIIFLITASILIFGNTAWAERFVGEHLEYQFGWKGFIAAKTIIDIEERNFNGNDCYKITMQINSLPKLDWIWKVRDKMTSWSRKSDFETERYVNKQREGNFHLDTVVDHDHEVGILMSDRTRYKKGKKKKYNPKWAKAEGHMDPVGALLYMRAQDLSVGAEYKYKVFDGVRSHEIHYKVVGTEKIKTPLGEFDTFKVIPKILQSIGKDKEAMANKVSKVTVWMTKTPEHSVVRVESKTKFGAIYAEIINRKM